MDQAVLAHVPRPRPSLNGTTGLPPFGEQLVTTGEFLGEVGGRSMVAGGFKGIDGFSAARGLFTGPDLLPALDALSLDQLDALAAAVERTDNTVLAGWFGAEDKASLRAKIAHVREKRAAADQADRKASDSFEAAFRLWLRNRADEGTRIHERQMELLGRR